MTPSRKEDEIKATANAHLLAEVERLRAELAEAQKDAARYRFLRDCSLGHDSVVDSDNMVQVFVGTDPAQRFFGLTLDSAVDRAIDAAMEEGER